MVKAFYVQDNSYFSNKLLHWGLLSSQRTEDMSVAWSWFGFGWGQTKAGQQIVLSFTLAGISLLLKSNKNGTLVLLT